MYFTAAGTRFFIGTARPGWWARVVDASDFDGEAWVPVEGVSSIGRTGGEWQTVADTIPASADAPDEPWIENHVKDVRPSLSMQIVMATIEDDPGQLAMLAAEASVPAYPFRMELPTGGTRQFVALVVSADQAVDEANSVLCWSFGLLLQSTLMRG